MKCRYLMKIALVNVLTIAVLMLVRYCSVKRKFESSSRGRESRDVDKEAAVLESEIQQGEARIVAGLGDGGGPVHWVGERSIYRVMKEQSEQTYAMNAYLSDRIPYVRNLIDYRHSLCKNVTYDAELPSASVVMVFRTQPLSVVLRAVWSVLSSVRRRLPWYRSRDGAEIGYEGQDPASPYVYLKELILVDDNSTLPELKGKLSYYVRTRLPPDLVKIIRPPNQNLPSVAGARLAGARAARGAALVFLDAHCEAQRDWLRPLLQRVKDHPHAVAAPLADSIDPATFEYKATDEAQVGGFTFGGENTWIQISDREISRRGPCDIAPTRSPVLHNGPFAVDRRMFWKMGGYDDGMSGWGVENLELSFRFWMCGGMVEVVPCSRIGQVYVHYCPNKHSLKYDFAGLNAARMAEVWLDDYKELLYLSRPELRNNPAVGNLNSRRVMRKRLQCRSFNWYLENVYPEKFVPVRDSFDFVRFSNNQSAQCLDSLQLEAPLSPLGLHPCHGQLTPSQFFTLSLNGELRDEVRCADIYELYAEGNRPRFDTETRRRVLMADCEYKRSSARWQYASGRLRHVPSGLCLAASGARADAPAEVHAAPCSASSAQLWQAEQLFARPRKPELTKAQIASLIRIRDGEYTKPQMKSTQAALN